MLGKVLGAMIGAALGMLLAWSAPLAAVLSAVGALIGHFVVDREVAPQPKVLRAPSKDELLERPVRKAAPARRVAPPPKQKVSLDDLLLARHGVAVRYYPALAGQTESIARRADPAALTELAQYVQQQRRVAGHPLSAKLFAHALLQRVVSACQPSRSAPTASR